jgi:tRNA uracil 4-sulfurtransferase
VRPVYHGSMNLVAPLRHLLVHYNEIALKGRNRRFFEEKLVDALRIALWGQGWKRVKRLFGRLLVEFEEGVEIAWEEVRLRVSRVFGVSNFSPALLAPLDIEKIEAVLGEALESVAGTGPRSFAIVARRPNKSFPLNSSEVGRRLGRMVQERTGWTVSLDAPDLPIHVYILDTEAFISFDRTAGPGGMPAGTAGKVLCLISGGIDSPVAALRLLRRGAIVDYVHFHSFPHTSAASIDKVKETVAAIQLHRGRSLLHVVPFADLQRRIVASCPEPLRVLLYRRFMMRTAEAIARREGALALVTGESLGQVASQTLENLAAIERAVSLPVLRPLIGMDKLEIVREAQENGTFEISIRPHEDCCGFLMPKNPATRSTAEELAAAEGPFDAKAEVEALLAAAEVVEIGRGGRRGEKRPAIARSPVAEAPPGGPGPNS